MYICGSLPQLNIVLDFSSGLLLLIFRLFMLTCDKVFGDLELCLEVVQCCTLCHKVFEYDIFLTDAHLSPLGWNALSEYRTQEGEG